MTVLQMHTHTYTLKRTLTIMPNVVAGGVVHLCVVYGIVDISHMMTAYSENYVIRYFSFNGATVNVNTRLM